MTAHEFLLIVEPECSPRMTCKCLYDPTDETRPCWPWETETIEPHPLPAPQPSCTYADWLETMDDLPFDGELTIQLTDDGCDWSTDAPRFLFVAAQLQPAPAYLQDTETR